MLNVSVAVKREQNDSRFAKFVKMGLKLVDPEHRSMLVVNVSLAPKFPNWDLRGKSTETSAQRLCELPENADAGAQ